MKASITLVIIVSRDSNTKVITEVDLDFRRSMVLWDGVAAASDVDEYNSKQRGTNLKVLRALIALKLGESEFYSYLTSIRERQKTNGKLCNKNVRKLFGTKANGEGRFVDLFAPLPNRKLIVGDAIENVTIRIREQGRHGHLRATDSAMSAILSGIETSNGTFIPQLFEGDLTTDVSNDQSRELAEPSIPLPSATDLANPKVTKPTESLPPKSEPPKVDGKSIERVFANVIKEIERILNRRQVLRQFIADSTTRFIENRAGQWCVTDEVRARSFKLKPILKEIEDRLDDFVADSQDWKCLGEVAGGLAVLGLDRSWVAQHLADARSSSAQFSAYDESIGIGGDRQVHLLHLVSCGLADSISRLDRLFGDPPLDDRRLPNDTGIDMGTMEDDKETQLKIFLIRNVVGRREKINPLNETTFEAQLEQLREICVDAFADHGPYYACSPQYKDLKDLIRKVVKVKDLLLIFPDGGRPNSLVSDNISVFRSLGRIFDAVQANTGIQS